MNDETEKRIEKWSKLVENWGVPAVLVGIVVPALVHTFDSSGRMALGALSYINVETRSRSMLVQAFHTFPDDYAIVKSQSLFQLPRSS